MTRTVGRIQAPVASAHECALRQRGSGLIEVLISVVVMSFGLLGVAGLQLTALRSNNQSYERSQATALAYELIDAMRSNRIAAASGAFQLVAGEAPPAGIECVEETVCTQQQAAAYALDQWHRRLTLVLPAGTARVQCSSEPCGPGRMQTLTLLWDEDRLGVSDASCPPAAVFDRNIHLACIEVGFTP
ncbi:MAG: type IV pilus modification protein PilV [Panacagrimonas sp.]